MLDVRGKSGRITFDGTTVSIIRDRMRAKILAGGGTKQIPIHQITAVQFKRAGLWPGYIQFTIGGGVERRSQFGKTVSDAARDENSVVFGRRGNTAFAALAAEIRKAMTASQSGRHPVGYSVSPAEQIQQLARLRDQGLVSPQEFEAKRQELLGRM